MYVTGTHEWIKTSDFLEMAFYQLAGNVQMENVSSIQKTLSFCAENEYKGLYLRGGMGYSNFW